MLNSFHIGRIKPRSTTPLLTPSCRDFPNIVCRLFLGQKWGCSRRARLAGLIRFASFKKMAAASGPLPSNFNCPSPQCTPLWAPRALLYEAFAAGAMTWIGLPETRGRKLTW